VSSEGNGKNGNGHKNGSKLRPRQEKFVEAYLETDNASEAARQAGYCPDNPDNAGIVANGVLKSVKIQERIQERRNEFRQHSDIKAKDIIGLFATQAVGHLRDFFDEETGEFIGWKAVRERQLGSLLKAVTTRDKVEACPHCLKKIDVKVTRVELHSNQQAAAHLSEIFGLKQQPRLNDRDKIEMARRVKQDWTFYTKLAAKLKEQHGVELGRDELIETVCSGFDPKLRAAVVQEIEGVQ
jgi:phage terminase small subunit